MFVWPAGRRRVYACLYVKVVVARAVCEREMTKPTTHMKLYCVFRSKYDDVKMSCQCFAEMLIYFRFGKFLALRVGPIFSKGHAEIFWRPCVHGGSKIFSCSIPRRRPWSSR